jgi:hypothetical protein
MENPNQRKLQHNRCGKDVADRVSPLDGLGKEKLQALDTQIWERNRARRSSWAHKLKKYLWNS